MFRRAQTDSPLCRYQQALSDYLSIARLLRLSHKYLVTNLRKHLMELLAPMFPSTFEGFLIAETDAMRGSAPFDYTSTQCCAVFANTFCDVDAQLLLPITLLRLCRSSLEDIALSSLSSENTRNLLIGRSRLASFARDTVFLHNFHNSDTCGACASCSQRCFSKKGAITVLLGDDFWVDPLCERDVSHAIICSRCAISFRNSHSSGRKIAWERLPGFFNLPAWPQLHAAESAFNSNWYALHIVRARSYSYWPCFIRCTHTRRLHHLAQEACPAPSSLHIPHSPPCMHHLRLPHDHRDLLAGDRVPLSMARPTLKRSQQTLRHDLLYSSIPVLC